MWYLVCESKGRSYRLTPDKAQYQVSRTVGDIILSGDQSVSRKHAVLALESDPMGVKIVTIKDLGSKYGTYLNGFKLDPDTSQIISDGNVITFGCQWNEWRFHSKPLVVTSSNMPTEAKMKLKRIVSELGGVVVGDWQESCSHLIMVEILLTAKVVCALASGTPIVTPDYWEKFKEALDGQKAPPSYEEFIPPLKESILNKNRVSFAINEQRKTLFSGKTFVFSTEKQLKKYKTIVVTAGGECETLTNTKKRVEDLCSSGMVVMQHVSITDTQPPPLYDAVLQVMRGKGLKPIPESEIGLAILMCSLDTYCNMSYNVVGSVLEGGVVMSQVKRAEVLAEDSQMSVIDSVSIKTEEPDIKTEREAETTTTTPPVPITESSSLSSDGSFKRWQNHQETLPCGFGESSLKDKNSADGNSSPNLAPGPSRKRPPSIEIGEPSSKRCPTDVAPKGGNKDNGLSKDAGSSKDQGRMSSINAERRGIGNSLTPKRKLKETDNGFMTDPPLKKPFKAKPGSFFFPDIDEVPVAVGGDFTSLLQEDDDDMEECNVETTKRKVDEADSRASNGGFSNRAREPRLLSGLMQTAPSTSRGSKPSDLDEEEKNWAKDAERGVKAIVDAGWGGGFKGIDGKFCGKLVDEGCGMCVKYSKLLIIDRLIQHEETPQDSSVVNFKRFRKGRPPVTSTALPYIIGESDLVRR